MTPEGVLKDHQGELLTTMGIEGTTTKAKDSSTSAASIKGYIEKQLPLAYIGNLQAFLLDYLDRLDK